MPLLLCGCHHEPTAVELPPKQIAPGWTIQIAGVSEPEKALVLSDSGSMGLFPVPPKEPSDSGRKWVAVRLRVTPPADSGRAYDPGFDLRQIALVSPGASERYALDAVSAGGKWKDQSGAEFDEFIRPPARVQLKDGGRLRAAISAHDLVLLQPEAQELAFLFAVPKRAPKLLLELGAP